MDKDQKIEFLITNLIDQVEVVQSLQELRKLAKGNDDVKGLIGERISPLLVGFIKEENIDMEMRVEAGKLLRSITVYRKNKSLGNECSSILQVLSSTNNRSLKLALTATLWNLSALGLNRVIIVERRGLYVLAECLNGDDLGMQREAAGCIRNITLDENCKEAFIESGVLNALIGLADKSKDTTLLICVSGALRNLSLSENVRKNMCTNKGLLTLSKLLLKDNSKVQGLALTTVANITQDAETRQAVANSPVLNILADLVSSTTIIIRERSATALKNLSPDDLDREKLKTVETALKKSGMLNTERTKYDNLLKEMNIDGNIKWQDIELNKKIGEGVYGDVWLADYHGYPVACKVIKKKLTSKDAEKTIEELRLMKALKHPNVILLMGACLNDQQQIMIVTEYAARGDLKSVAPQVQNLRKRLDFALDIIKGLSWLSAHNIVHRDLKLPNLLVDNDYTIKVGDFGLSLQLQEGIDVHRFGGNVKYSAPEILRARYNESITVYPYHERTDVYSFGLMFWELLTLKPLFVRSKEYKGKKGLAKYVLEGNRPELMPQWPESLSNLLEDCWNENQEKRPLFRGLIEMWEHLVTEILCTDTIGIQIALKLWRNDRKKKVEFDLVLNAIAQYCEVDPFVENPRLSKMLRFLMCKNMFEDEVTFERFCTAISWFGPLDTEANLEEFYHKISETLRKRYFQAFITDSKVHRELKRFWECSGNRRSYFVIRLSKSDIGEFLISFIDPSGDIEHKKILNINGQYWIEETDQYFDNWRKLKTSCKKEWHIGAHLPWGEAYSSLMVSLN